MKGPISRAGTKDLLSGSKAQETDASCQTGLRPFVISARAAIPPSTFSLPHPVVVS
jgi:hypothetical protein